MSQSRSRECILHLAHEIRGILSTAAVAGAFNSDVAGGFGNAKIDRIDERNGQKRDDVEQQVPLALWAARDDRCVRNECAINRNVMGASAAHAKDPPRIEHFDTARSEW